MFVSPHTTNRIYLLRNCFSNYLYLKYMHITLKEIGKILFVSVLRILLICKFLNFTAVFIRKKRSNFSKFAYSFTCKKVNFSLIHPTHITIQLYQVLRFCQLSVKVTFKQTMKNNDYWIFLVFFVVTLVFFLELETRVG